MIDFMRRHAAKFGTATIVAALYVVSVPDGMSSRELASFGSTLRLEPTYIDPADNGRPFRTIRTVNPSIRHINAWISSVGSSVALADIAGGGLPQDICLVDPRNDSVSVLPAPETGGRFQPFAIKASHEGYDPATIAPMGCLPADLNEDGRMDLLVYYWGRTPLVFLRNDQAELSASAFTQHEIVAEREVWNTNAALLADVDGDGHPDLIFGNYFRDGDRVLDPESSVAVEMQHSMSRAENAGRNRLLLWQGADRDSVAYSDASDAFTDEMANGWTLALAARDLDADAVASDVSLSAYRHLPELYVANDFGNDRLLLNRSAPGNPRFEVVEGRRGLTTPRSKALGQGSFKGMGVDFGDVTGDGRPAIAVSNISAPYALVESHFLFVHDGDDAAWGRGVAPYRDEGGWRGVWFSNWAWDIKFADLLNDGRPAILQTIGFIRGDTDRWPELHELAMGNDELLRFPGAWPRFSEGDELSGRDHDRLYLAMPDGRYVDVWNELGLDTETISRGIATADVFGDGRLSIAIARQWASSLFLRNVSPDTGRAIVVDLRVPGAVARTRAAIGAEARVGLPDGRIVTSFVDGGSGHGGKRAAEIHLGVGSVAPDQKFDVEFRWRDTSGPRSEIRRLSPGRHRIVLGRGDIAESARPDSRSTEGG